MNLKRIMTFFFFSIIFISGAEDECNVFLSAGECHNVQTCFWDIVDRKCKFNCIYSSDVECNADPRGCQWVNYNSSVGECFNVDIVHDDCNFFTDGRQKECGCNDYWKTCVLSKAEGICHYSGVVNMICLSLNNPTDCLAEPHCVFQFKCISGTRSSESCLPGEKDGNEDSGPDGKKDLNIHTAVLLIAIVVPIVVVIIVIVAVVIGVVYYRKKTIKSKTTDNADENKSSGVSGCSIGMTAVEDVGKPEPMAIQEDEEFEQEIFS